MSIPSQPTVQPFFGIRRERNKPFFLTEFLNAYVGTRTDLMRREYENWLKQTDPIEKAKIQARLMEADAMVQKARLAYAGALATGDLAKQREIIRLWSNVTAAKTRAEADTAVAALNANVDVLVAAMERQTKVEENALVTAKDEQMARDNATDLGRRLADAYATNASDEVIFGLREEATAKMKEGMKTVQPSALPQYYQLWKDNLAAPLMAARLAGGTDQKEAEGDTALDWQKISGGIPAAGSPAVTTEDIQRTVPRYGGQRFAGPEEALSGLRTAAPEVFAPSETSTRTSTAFSTTLPPGTVGVQTPVGTLGAQAAPQAAPGVQIVPTPPAGYTAAGQAGGVTYYVPPPAAPAVGTGTLFSAAQAVEPGGRMDIFSEDRTGKSWDYGPRTFFGKQAPDVDELLARMVALKKRDPAKYSRFRDMVAAANPRATAKEGREIERALDKAVTAAEKVDVPGGAPATGPSLDLTNYGPDFYDDKAQAIAALYAQHPELAKMTTEEQAAINDDFNKRWPKTAVAGLAPPIAREQREAYEEIVNAPADVRALEAARTRVVTGQEPSLLSQFPEGTPVPYSAPTLGEPVRPPFIPAPTIVHAAPIPVPRPPVIQAPPPAPLPRVATPYGVIPALPQGPGVPIPPVNPYAESVARTEAAEKTQKAGQAGKGPEPAPKKVAGSAALAADEKAYMDRLAAKEKTKEKPGAGEVPEEYLSRASESGDLNAPDKEDADAVQSDAAMVLAPVPEKKKKNTSDEDDEESEPEE